MDFRHFPLADAVEAVDQQASVIVFAERELPGSSDAPVCFCGGDFDDDMLNCVKCKTVYHKLCVAWNDGAGGVANKYRCGFCNDDPDEDGVRIWDGDIAEEYVDDVNDGRLHRNDNQLEYQGRGKLRKRIGNVQQASWENVTDRVARTATKVHEKTKAQYDRAKARIAQGGHHIVDRAAAGGVREVPMDDRVVDFLEGLGEI